MAREWLRLADEIRRPRSEANANGIMRAAVAAHGGEFSGGAAETAGSTGVGIDIIPLP
jgi:hypothetical protein